ncbi:type II toxin-antitoxin system Phd/YefM family antitoxin [Rivularia sp. UHCC 0363]
MRITNIYEAKTNLSKLIEAVLAGEDVIIAEACRLG